MVVQRSTMSGSLWKLHIKVGDQVEAGQEIAILESMKMEIPIQAEGSGTITEVYKIEGDFVQEDEVLAKIE